MAPVRELLLGAVGGRVVQRLLTGRLSRVHPDLTFPQMSVSTHELSVPSTAGPTPVTVYQATREDEAGPPPVHVNFHGGGYILGNPGQDDPLCRFLAVAAGVVVLNVDYVLAPQHRFPAAVHQCFDVVAWVRRNAADHGWDGERISVGGQSAGGGIAAAVARQAAAAGAPPIALQVLHYPPLDLVTDAADKPALARKAVITPGISRLFNAAYIPDPADRADPLASPAMAGADSARGVAPALVLTPELDRLHGEGVRYVEILREAGVPVVHHDLPGVDHAYNITGADTGPEEVRRIYATIAEAIIDAHRRD